MSFPVSSTGQALRKQESRRSREWIPCQARNDKLYSYYDYSTLISRGMRIPNNSFVVGAPAEIKGEATKEQLASLEKSIQIYIELTEEYKGQGL